MYTILYVLYCCWFHCIMYRDTSWINQHTVSLREAKCVTTASLVIVVKNYRISKTIIPACFPTPQKMCHYTRNIDTTWQTEVIRCYSSQSLSTGSGQWRTLSRRRGVRGKCLRSKTKFLPALLSKYIPVCPFLRKASVRGVVGRETQRRLSRRPHHQGSVPFCMCAIICP